MNDCDQGPLGSIMNHLDSPDRAVDVEFRPDIFHRDAWPMGEDHAPYTRFPTWAQYDHPKTAVSAAREEPFDYAHGEPHDARGPIRPHRRDTRRLF